MSEGTVPELWGTATLDELNAIERFYFPPSGPPPRQPRTNFCQVDAETFRVILSMAIAWRLANG